MAQGVNSLIGYESGVTAVGAVRAESGAPTEVTGAVEDGVEFFVAAIVLSALVVLILFRIGGFQAVIAAR